VGELVLAASQPAPQFNRQIPWPHRPPDPKARYQNTTSRKTVVDLQEQLVVMSKLTTCKEQFSCIFSDMV